MLCEPRHYCNRIAELTAASGASRQGLNNHEPAVVESVTLYGTVPLLDMAGSRKTTEAWKGAKKRKETRGSRARGEPVAKSQYSRYRGAEEVSLV